MARKCRSNLTEITTAERIRGPDLVKKRKLNREDSRRDRLSLSSDSDESCCSSNGSRERRTELSDLEDEFETGTSTPFRRCKSKETAMCDCDYSDLDSTVPKLRRVTAEKMPTDAELDEFFAEAEKSIQKQFIDKYNYDIVKDEPLEGRYEWIPLKQ